MEQQQALTTKITFRVAVEAALPLDQAVFVCGSHSALGSWEAGNAVRLFANEQNPLLWSTEEGSISLPLKQRVEYNYLVKEIDGPDSLGNTLSLSNAETLRRQLVHSREQQVAASPSTSSAAAQQPVVQGATGAGPPVIGMGSSSASLLKQRAGAGGTLHPPSSTRADTTTTEGAPAFVSGSGRSG
ncbi:unnamed protein product, partial [Amoebophrya sp. A120]|eukprot:GSA120T00003110001.1